MQRNIWFGNRTQLKVSRQIIADDSFLLYVQYYVLSVMKEVQCEVIVCMKLHRTPIFTTTAMEGK
jgi:hypothetical protein